jgi:hypothetical protein
MKSEDYCGSATVRFYKVRAFRHYRTAGQAGI